MLGLAGIGCSPPLGTLKQAEDTAEAETDSIRFGGIVMSPSAIDFGGVPLGASTTETLTLTNSNSIESMVTTATTDSERFTIEDDVVLPITLAENETTEIYLRYTPSRIDAQDGLLNIGVAGQVGYAEIGLFGRGTDEDVPTPSDTGSPPSEASLRVRPEALDFGSIPAMSETTDTVTLYNDGDMDLTITEILSTSASIFSPTTDIVPPITLTGGSSLDFEVTFSPPAERDYVAIIDVETDGSDLQIPVTGTGGPPDCEVCAPRLTVMSSSGTDSSLDLVPAFVLGCTANGTLTMENTGDQDLVISAVNVRNDLFGLLGTFSATWAGPVTLPPGGVSIAAIDYVTTSFAVEVADLATDQNVVHILSNDPSRPDWVIELSATVLACGL